MNGAEMVPSRDVADLVARERAGMIEALRDLVVQDAAFLARARSEGFDVHDSVRLAVTSEVSADGRPTLAVEGGVEGLPDQIFPRLHAGYVVRYQAALRLPEVEGGISPQLTGTSSQDTVTSEGGA